MLWRGRRRWKRNRLEARNRTRLFRPCHPWSDMLRYLIPLAVFAVLVVFLAIGLTRNPQEIPSALINKAAPEFRLPQLNDPAKTFAAADMRGKVWMLNVWVSWCIACREEHPYLFEYAKSGVVPIV